MESVSGRYAISEVLLQSTLAMERDYPYRYRRYAKCLNSATLVNSQRRLCRLMKWHLLANFDLGCIVSTQAVSSVFFIFLIKQRNHFCHIEPIVRNFSPSCTVSFAVLNRAPIVHPFLFAEYVTIARYIVHIGYNHWSIFSHYANSALSFCRNLVFTDCHCHGASYT